MSDDLLKLMGVSLRLGDCVELMRAMPDASVDSIVTDPPYELGFMGKGWDKSGIANNPAMWAEALRVLKPGGHLLAFSGTRTYHRMVCAIEDAGFEVRDQIGWAYGSGFPKSLDVSKAIDKLNGREFEDRYELGRHIRECREKLGISRKEVNKRFEATAICNHWEAQDRNNALPPTPEHWESLKQWLGCDPKFDALVDRIGAEREVVGHSDNGIAGGSGKHAGQDAAYGFGAEFNITAPATEAARQWQGWGTALKPAWEPICVARKPLIGTVAENVLAHGTGALNIDGCRVAGEVPVFDNNRKGAGSSFDSGSNRTGETREGRWPANLIHDGSDEVLAAFPGDGDSSAARFFYCAKASKSDRGEGNNHPTVKPTELMRYLCRLVTPPGGVVLDPFMGSGSTGKAAILERLQFIGLDLTPEYVAIARARCMAALTQI